MTVHADRCLTRVPVGDVSRIVGIDEVEAGDTEAHRGIKLSQVLCLVGIDDGEAGTKLRAPECAYIAIGQTLAGIDVAHHAGQRRAGRSMHGAVVSAQSCLIDGKRLLPCYGNVGCAVADLYGIASLVDGSPCS